VAASPIQFSASEVVQLAGSVVSFSVVLEKLVTTIRDWRGGSPELRLIRQQLNATNQSLEQLLKQIVQRLRELK
jgi:hypothetical protein